MTDHEEVAMTSATAATVVTTTNEIPGQNADAGTSGRKKNRHRAVPLDREFRKFTLTAAGDAITPIEVRKGKKPNELIVEGEPIVYSRSYSVYDMFGEFRETIHPGSLTDILDAGVDCRLLLNHDGLALGRTTSGTMELEDSDTALRFRATLDARQQLANDFAIAVERGDMSEMSVGMIVGRDEWGESEGVETRDITKLDDLVDVSGVTYAASPTTSIGIAQRMAAAMPVESRARLRRLEVSLRNGDTKPEDVLEALVALRSGQVLREDRGRAEEAASGLQSVLEAVGVEVEEPEVEERAEEPEAPKGSSSLRLALELRRRRR